MRVTLIDHSGKGNPDPDHAINVLIFTKNTRLTMSPSGMEEIASWSKERKLQELQYMSNTIPSSHEFVDYTFMIEGVTRAFTHQLVRTRTASFAQQTMRVLNVSEGPGWEYLTGPTIKGNINAQYKYDDTMAEIDGAYKGMIADGVAIEDARGILPTNILTNIVMKINLRNFVELVHKRSSSRVQGEYHDVLDAMQKAVLEVHPWVALFIDRTFDQAAKDLDKAINEFHPEDFTLGTDRDDAEKLKKWKTDLIKLVDQLRAKQ